MQADMVLAFSGSANIENKSDHRGRSCITDNTSVSGVLAVQSIGSRIRDPEFGEQVFTYQA